MFHNIFTARTSSVQTFDSLDFARYSDDGERQVDERVAGKDRRYQSDWVDNN